MAALFRLGIRVAVLFLVSICPRVFAESSPPAHAKISLVAENNAVTLGGETSIGLRFEMEPGWHIYWRNPGDSGEPPRIQWRLPAGFHAGAIQWPVPQRISDHTLVDYGYEGTILLMVRLRAPAAPTTHSAAIEATVKYLVCRDICIPGNADPKLALPVLKSGRPLKWASLFRQTRARLPKPAPRSWKISAESGKDYFTLTLRTGRRERQAVFFPFEPGQIENAAPQQTTPLRDGVRLRLQKPNQLLHPVPRLEGLVVLGGRRGFIIKASLASSITRKRRRPS